jgi:hypothetical protein
LSIATDSTAWTCLQEPAADRQARACSSGQHRRSLV